MSDEKIIERCWRCGRPETERGMGSAFRGSDGVQIKLCHVNLDGTKADPDCYSLVRLGDLPTPLPEGRYVPLQKLVDRLQVNRLKITGHAGDEPLLDEIIAALNAEVVRLKETELDAAIETTRDWWVS